MGSEKNNFADPVTFHPPKRYTVQMHEKEYNSAVREWSDRLFRFVLKSTGNMADADDIVQNSFEQLWIKRSQVEAAKAKSFLFTVAYNQCVDNHRVKTRRPHTALVDSPASGPTPGVKKAIEKALGNLDSQSRTLVLLKDYEGYSYEEIGRITGLSDSQVRVYLFRARKQLKEFLVCIENVI